MYGALDVQVYRYFGSDRVKGIHKLVINEETLAEFPNLDAKVHKAQYAAFLEEEARYESGELVRQEYRWCEQAESFIDVATGLAVNVGP
ncbi:hypothetical protein D3C81_1707380 [compost metagenome]